MKDITDKVDGGFAELAQKLADMNRQSGEQMMSALAAMHAEMKRPKRAVKNPDGSWSTQAVDN